MSDNKPEQSSGIVARIDARLKTVRNAHTDIVARSNLRLMVAVNAFFWTIAVLLLYPIIARVVVQDNSTAIMSQYWPWISSYYFPQHKFEILGLAVVIAIIGLLAFVLSLQLVSTTRDVMRQKRLLGLTILIGIATSLFNLVFGLISSPGLLVQALLLGFIVTAIVCPVIPASWLERSTFQIRRNTTTAVKLAVLLLLAEAIGICAFLGLNCFPIASDYLQIPSTVLIRDEPTTPRRPVDTIEFINKNLLFGNQQVPDFRVRPSGDMACAAENRIDLPVTPIILAWVRLYRDSFYISQPEGVICFVGTPLSATITQELAALYPNDRATIASADVSSRAERTRLLEREVSFSEVDFSAKVKSQLVSFFHDLEGQFHHHFQYLNPIKEHALGQPLAKINAPYGLSFLVVEHMMRLIGGITYPSFLASMFLLQALYVLAFAGLVHWLLRSWLCTLGVTAVVVGSLTGLGVQTLYTSFGYGPARHGLDLLVILFLALYLRKIEARFLVLAISVALLNIGLDRFVGAFCAVALAGALAFRVVTRITTRPRLESALAGILMLATGAGFVLIGRLLAKNPYAEQFFQGVWGFSVDRFILFTLLAWACAALACTIWSTSRQPQQRKSLGIFLIAYTLLFVFYWMMVPNYGHLYKVLPLLALTTAVVWRESLKDYVAPSWRFRMAAAGVVLALLTWVQHSRFLIATGAEKFQHLSAHQIFMWDFPRMKVSSTMDPSGFRASAELIERNTSARESVSILSEFDSILLFLSDRISAMPHFEVGTFLNSPAHSQRVIEDIKSRKPETLIVDSCIRCSPAPFRPTRPIPWLDVAYNTRASDKNDRLQRLRDVFSQVEPDYTLIAEGPLVSVWRRK